MINIPFNFQPQSVSVKTSSYSIPAGFYAYVVFNVENGGSGTINGSTVVTSQAEVSGTVSAVDVSGTGTLLTVSSGYRFEGQIYAAGSSNITIGGESVLTSHSGTAEIKAGTGQIISASSTASLTGYQIREHEGETNAVFATWVPTGTTIAGSGTWRATVSLYNELS